MKFFSIYHPYLYFKIFCIIMSKNNEKQIVTPENTRYKVET